MSKKKKKKNNVREIKWFAQGHIDICGQMGIKLSPSLLQTCVFLLIYSASWVVTNDVNNF